MNEAVSLKSHRFYCDFPTSIAFIPRIDGLNPKSLGPQSAGGSLGYQLFSPARELDSWRAWYISKVQCCLGSWLKFSKHLSLRIMGGHIKVWCCGLAHLHIFLQRDGSFSFLMMLTLGSGINAAPADRFSEEFHLLWACYQTQSVQVAVRDLPQLFFFTGDKWSVKL